MSNNEQNRGGSAAAGSPAFRIASLAVLTAVTAVFTFAVRIPVAPTRGYLNLGDVAIYFSAFSFGPLTALVTGGLGTALADLISGYSQFAPISLVVHGLQGLVAGLIAVRGAAGRGGFSPYWLLGVAAGLVVMCAGYLVAEAFMFGIGPALVELPGNVLQNVAGALGGVPLALAVRRAYPPIAEMRW